MDYAKIFDNAALEKAQRVLIQYYAIINGDLIQKRREEISHPIKEPDDNCGGGSSNTFNSTTENIAIKLSTDRKLKEYQSIISRVLNAMQYLDEEEIAVVEAFYNVTEYCRHRQRTLKGVSDYTGFDETFCKNTRYKVLTLLKTAP